MKKIFSFILVLMLLPIASIFVGCKDKGYNLNNLQNDFNAIEIENDNIKKQGTKLVFDYSNHLQLETTFENVSPYMDIAGYNEVLENIMAFAFEYVDECSNNSVKDVATKDEVKSRLNDLKASYRNVNNYVNLFADAINLSYPTDIYNDICISGFENLLTAYEDLFYKAIKFNETLANLYFHHLLSNSNPDITSLDVNNFDVNLIVNRLNAKLKYQITNLSACFVEMYFDGSNLAEDIANSYVLLDLDKFDYFANVEEINKIFVEQVAATKAQNNKQEFYDLSVQAYNAQETIKNDNLKFYVARDKIKYAEIQKQELTSEQNLCKSIIESRLNLLQEYNNVLAQMVDLVG